MFKLACAVLALAVAVQSQDVPLSYSQELHPKFVINWGLSNDTIYVEFLVQTRGWVAGYLLGDDGKMLDIWWGGYDEDFSSAYLQDGYTQLDGLVPGPRYPDTVQDLQLVDVEQPPFESTTRLRFSRVFSPRDRSDVAIPENIRQAFLWAYADSDIASVPATESGISYITFRPAE